jgi:hypothetical protein
MDTVGLLAAWLGVLSLLGAVLLAAILQILSLTRSQGRTATLRMLRTASPSNAVEELVHLYGAAILHAIAAVAVIVVSIEVLDLAPGLLAATLPFPIDGKMLTRLTGLLSLVVLYYLLGRFSFLVVKIRRSSSGRIREQAETFELT